MASPPSLSGAKMASSNLEAGAALPVAFAYAETSEAFVGQRWNWRKKVLSEFMKSPLSFRNEKELKAFEPLGAGNSIEFAASNGVSSNQSLATHVLELPSRYLSG